jgi:hypothetical protein
MADLLQFKKLLNGEDGRYEISAWGHDDHEAAHGLSDEGADNDKTVPRKVRKLRQSDKYFPICRLLVGVYPCSMSVVTIHMCTYCSGRPARRKAGRVRTALQQRQEVGANRLVRDRRRHCM